jgi:hypothetical protein
MKQHESYWLIGRRNGALACIDEYRDVHSFLGKVIPEEVLYRFFRWYSGSKLGRWLNSSTSRG